MAKRVQWTYQMTVELIRLREDGASIAEAARRVGVGVHLAAQKCRMLGLSRRMSHGPIGGRIVVAGRQQQREAAT